MHLPAPFRAAVGLAATAADELKNLPDRAVELPMLAVSTALQLSLRAQQRYARLAARGEAVLNREQPPGEEPPAWATFDEPVSVEDLRRAALSQLDSLIDSDDDENDDSHEGDDDRGGAAAAGEQPRKRNTGDALAELFGGMDSGNGRSTSRMFDELFGVSDPAGGPDEHGDASSAADDPADGPADGATVTPITHAPGAAAKSGAAPRKSARKTPRKAATRKTPTKTAPVKTAEKTTGKAADEPAKKTPRKTTAASDDQPGKQVNKPRHTAPSKFDDAGDD